MAEDPSHVSYAGEQKRYDDAESVVAIAERISKLDLLRKITLTGNTFGLPACLALAKAMEKHEKIEHVQMDDMFTSRSAFQLLALPDPSVQESA